MDNPQTPATPPPLPPQPISEDHGGMQMSGRRRRWRAVRWVVGGLITLLVAAAITVVVVYQLALQPVDRSGTIAKRVEIVNESSSSDIGALLKKEGLIRNEQVFAFYTRLHGVQNQLQPGTYQLSQSQSLGEIVTALVDGPGTNEIEITFLPGATLQDHRQVLIEAGFSEGDVDKALGATYDHPLLATRPAGADLEGYIYGETHRFAEGTSVEVILTQFFDDLHKVVQANRLTERYQEQGLTLHEGIILASIIQKEVSGHGDSRQVAQVFYKRLSEGISLGADATFVYAARKAGDSPRVNYPSPYNTRIHTGLPPGPISSPGKTALLATADPADGDYLFFVSGDDGTNYFSRTEAEHIQNTKKYCIENCALF